LECPVQFEGCVADQVLLLEVDFVVGIMMFAGCPMEMVQLYEKGWNFQKDCEVISDRRTLKRHSNDGVVMKMYLKTFQLSGPLSYADVNVFVVQLELEKRGW